jgi:hypothetical protein
MLTSGQKPARAAELGEVAVLFAVEVLGRLHIYVSFNRPIGFS